MVQLQLRVDLRRCFLVIVQWGNDTLDTTKENDIEVVKVLGEESDLPKSIAP